MPSTAVDRGTLAHTDSSGGNGLCDNHTGAVIVKDGSSDTVSEDTTLVVSAKESDNPGQCDGVVNQAFVHEADADGRKETKKVGNGEIEVSESDSGDVVDNGYRGSNQILSENKKIGNGFTGDCDARAVHVPVAVCVLVRDPVKEGRGVPDTEPEHTVDKACDESLDSLQKVKKVENSLKKWVTGPNFLVYVSHFLSAWGDRMWSFGVGVFLVSIASENLQLPAVYGLSSGLTIFFLGALVGDWVDSTPRLKAAQASLILQNVFVVVCAAGVYSYLHFQPDIEEGETQHWLVPLCHGGIIFVAILANLSSLARTIAIERDWIVEICGKDKDMLAKMTASLRRIDQATLILAPIATGQIMTFAGLRNGAVFIAGWNVMSVFVEYYLVWKVYDTVPALRAKKGLLRTEITVLAAVDEEQGKLEADGEDTQELHKDGDGAGGIGTSQPESELADRDATQEENGTGDIMENTAEKKEEDTDKKQQADKGTADVAKEEMESQKKCTCSGARVFSRFITLYRGWRTYMGYSVALAGLALSCLYMTVLGFDNITVAYAMTQGVSESVLGILMGASAVFGILGTFAYPVLRRRLGLVRTGIFALSAEVLCLTLCVVSVWMAGSPFDPYYLSRTGDTPSCRNATLSRTGTNVSTLVNTTSRATYAVNTVPPNHLTIASSAGDNSTADCDTMADSGPQSYLSVGMLIAGIVLARFGLWTADLTITQLFLEEVRETERGIVNGVQSSLNKLMDVLKFVLVVAVPDTETFGFLIIISFAFICLGWLLYAIFLRKTRGHFFHFDKCVNSCGSKNYPLPQAPPAPA